VKIICVVAAICTFLFVGCGKEQQSGTATQKQGEVGKETQAPKGENLIIKPLEGVGALKFGMSRTEMEKILGPPERLNGMTCEYLSKGMAVMGSRSTAVAVILFGDANSPQSPLVQACKYKTDKGIGMGSTYDEMVKAYGTPSSVAPMSQGMVASYKQIEATFSLMNDRVIHMQFLHP
jgi:hypothetical protein